MRKKPTYTDIKDKILLAALPDVPFDGWSNDLQERICKKLKISDNDFENVFPNGMTDLIRHLSQWADAKTLEHLDKQDLSAMRIRDKITIAVRTRLEILSPYKQAVSSSLSYMALPFRSPLLLKMVWQTSDCIWWKAGDTATDYNHYTKRLLLSGVITSTTMFWLNDSSEDHEKTWSFLDRRIENVLKVGQKISSFRKKKPA